MLDALTGLLSHRDLIGESQPDVVLALWVDIDGMIWLNDQFGFEVGDRALASVAGVLRKTLGSEARGLFRVGGDEFLALLAGEDRAAASALAESVVQAVASSMIAYRRLDRASAGNLQVNVAVLHVSRELFTQSLSQYGLREPLHGLAADAVYAEKTRRGLAAGVVAVVLS